MELNLSGQEIELFADIIADKIFNRIDINLNKINDKCHDEYLNKSQVIKLIGCSYNTSYKYLNLPTFPKKKQNGKYSRREIEKWLKR